MRLCLACYGDRVAALLESATELRLFRMEGRALAACGVARATAGGRMALISQLQELEVGLLVCGGLTCCAQEALKAAGVQVLPWIGGAVDDVARAWEADSLPRLTMPGCGGRRRHCRGRNDQKERMDMSDRIIAVTSEGPKLDDQVDPRFGRAAGFIIVNLDGGAASFIDNGGSQVMAQGAGIQAAENVARAGAGVVLSGFVGPKAFAALAAAGIKVVQNVENMTVGQAVEKYRRGEFSVADAPNGTPHAGSRS
jgi:predicted Fe-Mo cluster-binding NifX family protein